MSKLIKFPFKYMKAIMKAFPDAEEKPLSIFELQKSAGACYPDTSEVTQMLSYLTSFGKVTQNGDGRWLRTAEKDNKPKKPGRAPRYLTEILEIIKVLAPDSPKSIDEVAKETGLETGMVEEFLPFLADITDRGHVVEVTNPRKSYKLEPMKEDGN
ncbi:MAG: hypothetical protein ACFFD4_09055 [Candidatus Odinarchaeota archaeon]